MLKNIENSKKRVSIADRKFKSERVICCELSFSNQNGCSHKTDRQDTSYNSVSFGLNKNTVAPVVTELWFFEMNF